MNKKPLDFSKPLGIRDGRGYTLYTHTAPGEMPVHGQIEGMDWPVAHTLNGSAFEDGRLSEMDLVNLPVKHTRTAWINIYLGKSNEFGDLVTAHNTKELADAYAGKSRIACLGIDLEFTEGEGL